MLAFISCFGSILLFLTFYLVFLEKEKEKKKEKVQACLVNVFTKSFSVFKQHFTYFNAFFQHTYFYKYF